MAGVAAQSSGSVASLVSLNSRLMKPGDCAQIALMSVSRNNQVKEDTLTDRDHKPRCGHQTRDPSNTKPPMCA
jgi:hypothetical protein